MHKLKRAVAVAAVLFAGACASKGCSCTAPIKGGYPVAERHEGALQIRATQSLFEYFSANGAALIPQLLPGGTTFDVPPQCTGLPAGTKICCATPAPMCRLQLTFTAVNLTPKAPNTIQLEADLQLKTLDNLPANIIGGTCMISIDTTRSGGPTMHVSAPLNFVVDQTTDLTQIQIPSDQVMVTGLDSGDINTNESGSTPLLCAGVGLLSGVIASLLESQVAGQVSSLVSGQLCMACTTLDDCNAFATACTSGQCVDAMGNCIQELGLESKVDVGSLLASFAPGTQASMDFLAVVGGWSVADTGLSLGMLGGGRGDPHSSCVPMVPAPSPAAIPPSTTFFTDVLPDGAEPYHLGIGVHVSELDSLGWGAFDGGALCLHIGTDSVPQLSSKTVGLIVPSLADLVHVPDAPLFLALRPAQPPTFTLGKGTFKTDPTSGMTTVDDPLMLVTIPDLAIDFYAFVDERFVRVMTLTSDLRLPISLDVDQMGQLVPLLGDVSKAFTNLRVTNSELLAESPDDLAMSFPTLLGVAVGSLTSALKPIALPAIMGLNLSPKAITTTDPDTTGANQFLSIFADLAGPGMPVELAADTTARLVRLALPTTTEFSVTGRNAAVPAATLALDGRTLDGLPLEWSWSIDGGSWSPFSSEKQIVIGDPVLWLQGHHVAHVRARAVGVPASLDATPAEVPLLVDTVPPSGSVDGAGNIVAHDLVSPDSALTYRWRNPDSSWSAWSSATHVPLGALQAQARDEVGNVGGLEFHGRTTDPPPPTGCSCDLSGRASSGGEASVLIVLLVVGLVARRRIALLLLLAAGCNQPGLGKGDFESPIHEIGRYHDVAVHAGVFHVSAYDDSTGDLAYARITDPTKPFGWQYVDGIDPMAVADTPGDYRHGVSDPGPDVGMYSSIAVTKSGEPRIAYWDATNGALKYAAGPHPWRIQTVQAGDGAHLQVGLYTQISLDENDIPTIAFLATGISDGMSGFTSELRVATASGDNPSATTDWKFTTVDSTRIRCAGLCPTGQACIQTAMVNGMPNGDPSQSTCQTPTSDCTPACATTEACLTGTCTAFLPFIAGDLPEGTGLFAQLRRTMSGLSIVYYDHSQGDLKLATQSGASFTVTTLDGNDPSTDRGQFCSAQYGDDGTLHVAYVDAIADRLLYVESSGASPSPTPEVVDDGMRDDGPHSVGAGAALHVDASGVEVVYQDQLLSDLLLATRANGWTHNPLDSGPAGYGWWPHLVDDKTQTWLTQFVYDRSAGNPVGSFVLEPLTKP